MDIERLSALEKKWKQLADYAADDKWDEGYISAMNSAADDLSRLIAELGQEVGAVACKRCGGKGFTDEGDPEMGSAIMDCYECWPAPVGATLADAAGDSALTLEAARELLAGAARGIARGEYSPAHTSEARDVGELASILMSSFNSEAKGRTGSRIYELDRDSVEDALRQVFAAMRQEGGE